MSRVAVLKGGSSLERQVSLRSGGRVEDALERLGHDVVSIDVGGDMIARLRAASRRRSASFGNPLPVNSFPVPSESLG